MANPPKVTELISGFRPPLAGSLRAFVFEKRETRRFPLPTEVVNASTPHPLLVHNGRGHCADPGRRPALHEEVGVIESATYDIAVSFAEEQRTVAEEVVEACRQRGLTVLEGHDLPQAQVRFLVPFVSTVDELVNRDHVLPVLTGEAPASSDVTYLRADEHLVDSLVARVEAAETAGLDRAPVAELATAFKQPAPAGNGLRRLAEQFAAAPPALTGRGLTGTVELGDSKIALRVEREGNAVYAVEMGSETVNFVVLGGSTDQISTLWPRLEGMLGAL
jgi:hypothetical protein